MNSEGAEAKLNGEAARCLLHSAAEDDPSALALGRTLSRLGIAEGSESPIALSAPGGALATRSPWNFVWKAGVVVGLSGVAFFVASAGDLLPRAGRTSLLAREIRSEESAVDVTEASIAHSLGESAPPSTLIELPLATPTDDKAFEKAIDSKANPHIAQSGSQGQSVAGQLTIADEIAALERVRQNLQRADSGKALTELDDYYRHFPGGALGVEASVLKIEAHLAHGDRRIARAEAKRFLLRQPTSTYAQRVRTIFDDVSHP